MLSRLTAPLAAAAAVVALAGLVLLTPAPAVAFSHGASPGFAGDQSDGATPRTCAVCHAGTTVNDGLGSVAVDVPAMAAPGETVAVTVTLDNQTPPAAGAAPRNGFEATVRDAATGERWGTLALADVATTQFAGSGTDYVTHTVGGAGQSTWTFEWAPGGERSGTARVYVAGNATNGDGTTGGDHVYTATADVAVEPVATATAPGAAFAVGEARPQPVAAGAPARLDVRLDRAGPVSVRLVDGLGRAVSAVWDGARPAGAFAPEISTGGLAAGVYFVVVDGPGGRRARPLVVR